MQALTVPDMSTGPRRITNTTFIERLIDEMARAGIKNKNQLANAVHVNRDTAGAWLNGASDPSGANLAYLADYFGCTMDYLWGRVDGRQEVYAVLPGRLRRAVDQIMRAAEELEEYSTPPSRSAAEESWPEDADGGLEEVEGLAEEEAGQEDEPPASGAGGADPSGR